MQIHANVVALVGRFFDKYANEPHLSCKFFKEFFKDFDDNVVFMQMRLISYANCLIELKPVKTSSFYAN